MATFALIHGSWHGAWCWELLIPELERRGHRVTAVDLPSDDPAATFEDYADVAVTALDGADDLVVVGHSLGGLTIPLVAQRRPVRRLIYLAALVPEVGSSFVDQQRRDGMLNPAYLDGLTVVGDVTELTDMDVVRELLYTGCDEDLFQAAVRRLRPQARYPLRQSFSLRELPAVPSSYIVCTADRMVDPAWSRRIASERLGVAATEFPGGHSPFCSRPAELAELLTALV
ncbi:alpha/beta hydrolase [Mycolicibacterium rhodesiae JS60]|nr:alpha/beta hydrolase [Mycolicibacterium rhodesiae JS60]